MARKITLTVPDSLYRKIDHWRSGFNLSRIFQDAVSEAIQKKEELQNRLSEDNSLSEIISRLKKEKQSWEKNLSIQAEKAGNLWASCARYEDLILAIQGPDSKGGGLPHLQSQIRESIQQISEIPASMNEQMEQMKDQIQESWFKGVRGFWETVQDKL